MLLKIMAFIRNVGDHFSTIRQAHLRNFADRGIRLLWRTRHDLNAHSAAKWIAVQGGRFRLDAHLAAAFAHELVDGRHTK